MIREDIDRSAEAEERLWSRIETEPMSGCWLWIGAWSRGGYGNICVSVHGRPTYLRAHRLAYILVHGGVTDDLDVCHRCDVPSCVNPAHLFQGSRSENLADMRTKGRGGVGELCGVAKLSTADIREIRMRWAAGDPKPDIAADHGISRTQTGRIISGTTWRHEPHNINWDAMIDLASRSLRLLEAGLPHLTRHRRLPKTIQAILVVYMARLFGVGQQRIADAIGVTHSYVSILERYGREAAVLGAQGEEKT